MNFIRTSVKKNAKNEYTKAEREHISHELRNYERSTECEFKLRDAKK